MPTITFTEPVEQSDGTHLLVADVTGTDLPATVEITEPPAEAGAEPVVRRLRYFRFGPDIPADAVEIAAAELRAQLPDTVPAEAPGTPTQTVEL